MRADAFLKNYKNSKRSAPNRDKKLSTYASHCLLLKGSRTPPASLFLKVKLKLNQAAVSGSCMNEDATPTRLSIGFLRVWVPQKKPLAFPISCMYCTYRRSPHGTFGPNYITSVSGRRNYNMNLLQTCRAMLPAGVVGFLVVVDSATFGLVLDLWAMWQSNSLSSRDYTAACCIVRGSFIAFLYSIIGMAYHIKNRSMESHLPPKPNVDSARLYFCLC